MEKRRHGRGEQLPSFSSTLLDAIYRSIDEPEGMAGKQKAPAAAPKPAVSARSKPPAAAASPRRDRRLCCPPPATARSTSSSSDRSSYGGFSSSEAESAAPAGRLRPIRTGMATACSSAMHRHRRSSPEPRTREEEHSLSHHEKKKYSSIKSKLREFRNSRSSVSPTSATPPSPGARLASFLNSLFSPSSRKPRPASAPSLASSYSHSCLNKQPSLQRDSPTVVFPPPATSTATKRSVRFAEAPLSSAPPRGKNTALLRRLVAAVAEDEDDSDDESDASSDLFELDCIAVAGGGGGELPVYETTRPYARGFQGV